MNTCFSRNLAALQTNLLSNKLVKILWVVDLHISKWKPQKDFASPYYMEGKAKSNLVDEKDFPTTHTFKCIFIIEALGPHAIRSPFISILNAYC